MLFNSIGFLIFLPVVFILYWFVFNRTSRIQNALLLVASYFFYACWDWRFLFLLIFSTTLDYTTGLKMSQASSKDIKKRWFWISVVLNLGFLGVFKYYNFFITSFSDLISQLGFQVNLWTLKVILPVGISFYTFHGLSYVIDIYNDKIKAERDFIDYSVFVSFFPLLVAGPIERATHLLPQIKSNRRFDYANAVSGLRQILWGLFKKVVIADQCADYANNIFANYGSYSGSTLFLGAIFFAFQIYGDFSGYSDIAIGTAKLFGIDLLKNFAFPYFSRDIAEFWRRWHISLSSWFRDYLYIPLGGSKVSNLKKVRNTFIIFLVSGFWHGANWTFIVWGFLNALYITPSILFKTNRVNIDIVAKGRLYPSIKEMFSIVSTFFLVVLAWIFFRSDSVVSAIFYLHRIFSESFFSMPLPNQKPWYLFVLVTVFLFIEWLGREGAFPLSNFSSKAPFLIRWVFYYLIIVLIMFFWGNNHEFIYFQF